LGIGVFVGVAVLVAVRVAVLVAVAVAVDVGVPVGVWVGVLVPPPPNRPSPTPSATNVPKMVELQVVASVSAQRLLGPPTSSHVEPLPGFAQNENVQHPVVGQSLLEEHWLLKTTLRLQVVLLLAPPSARKQGSTQRKKEPSAVS